MSNLIDAVVAYLDPVRAMRRAQARKVLSYYEAAAPTTTRKARREPNSGNVAVQRAGTSLREQARHLEQNHDLAMGALNALTINVVGAAGIGVEPQPRTKGGDIHDGVANQLLALYGEWCQAPEVTGQHDFASAQRLLARSWLRDGEVFVQLVSGILSSLKHGSSVPFSLEMLEADYVPMTLMSTSPRIVQGVEINDWGRHLAYHVLKEHPADTSYLSNPGTKRISADNVLHIAMRNRIRQVRGVSVFASVLSRFDDLKDYEESERIAAKVAASMAAFIIKGEPSNYNMDDQGDARDMRFRPGMVFDDLRPGEQIGTIDTNRPNPNLETYRSGQLRAAAGALGTTYSTLSRNYNGTYSAQRQELVEGWGAYAVLSSEFGARIVRPAYQQFVAMALAARRIKIPADLDLTSLGACLLVPPQMPWIDPEKEAQANALLEEHNYASGPEIIRRRGGSPSDVLDQQARWVREKEKRQLNAPAEKPAAPTSSTPEGPPTSPQE